MGVTTGRKALGIGAVAMAALVAQAPVGLGSSQSLWRAIASMGTDTVAVGLEDRGVGEGGTIVAESTVPHAVDIRNEGAPCWVRVRTVASLEGAEPAVLVPSPVPEGFVVADDGNAYLERPLAEGESVTWAEAIYDPWPDGGAQGADVGFTTVVEAIQRDHVAPDLSAPEPWGDGPVERAVARRAEP